MIIIERMEFKEYGEAIALLGTFLFVIQMLTPLPTFYRVVRTKTVGDLSVAPYNTAFLSCALWLLYGMVIQDAFVADPNLFGMAMQLGYTLCFYAYCNNAMSVGKQLCGSTLIFLAASAYCWTESDQTVLVQRMGFFCCLMTLCFFAAPFSNLRHVLRERNAESLPFLLIVFTFVVSFLWMLYGVAIDDLALQVTNLIGVILSTIQLFLIAWFRNPKQLKKKPILGL